MSERVQLDTVAFDAGTQIRAAIDQQVVSDYAEAMTNGATFPPIVLFHDGNRYYLADGFHRFMAAQRNQFREIEADVRAGTKDDALWFALGANKQNGQRLNEADKRHAVLLALTQWPDKSPAIIADHVGCSRVYVQRIRHAQGDTANKVDRVTGKDGRTYPAARQRTTAEENKREQIAMLVKSGASNDDIVKSIGGTSNTTIANVRREMGAGGPDKSRHAVQHRRDRMREMAANGYTSRQIASELGLSENGCRDTMRSIGVDVPADRAVGKTKRHDSNRIVEQIVADAENLIEGVNLIDYDDLDRTQIAEWLRSLQASREKLGSFIRRLMKEQQHGEAA